jgi:hypothetical protein
MSLCVPVPSDPPPDSPWAVRPVPVVRVERVSRDATGVVPVCQIVLSSSYRAPVVVRLVGPLLS